MDWAPGTDSRLCRFPGRPVTIPRLTGQGPRQPVRPSRRSHAARTDAANGPRRSSCSSVQGPPTQATSRTPTERRSRLRASPMRRRERVSGSTPERGWTLQFAAFCFSFEMMVSCQLVCGGLSIRSPTNAIGSLKFPVQPAISRRWSCAPPEAPAFERAIQRGGRRVRAACKALSPGTACRSAPRPRAAWCRHPSRAT